MRNPTKRIRITEIMPMLGYIVKLKDEDWCILLHGKTPGEAKSRFMRVEPSGFVDRSCWNDIRLTRLPGLDDVPITYDSAFKAGFEYSSLWEDPDENFDGPHNFPHDCDCEICKPKGVLIV